MTINVYSTDSPQNQIGKSLSGVDTLTGTLKENCSRSNPVILVEADMTTLTAANYMYITEFSRYYFIEDIVSVRNSLCEIHGRIDVLESFKTQILNSKVILKRQRDNWNLYLDDGSFMTYCNDLMYTMNFPQGFSGNTFVLVTTGPFTIPT